MGFSRSPHSRETRCVEPDLGVLDSLDWGQVREDYDRRVGISKELLQIYRQKSIAAFADLALGISDVDGNYSAAEHNLGPKILHPEFNANAAQRVFELAGDFISLQDPGRVPELIERKSLRYLKIGVGSEISCMVNPRVCWVANTRTIWTHLAVKHDSIRIADEHLKLYREADGGSEMEYRMWATIHAELRAALAHVAEIGQTIAKKRGVKPGQITYIWADAIASAFYATSHE